MLLKIQPAQKSKSNSNAIQTDNDIKLFVSIMRKKDVITNKEYKYYALELLLTQLDIALIQKQSIYAAARIVANYNAYKYLLITLIILIRLTCKFNLI